MSTREEALALIHQTVENNAELMSYHVRIQHVKDKFSGFSDQTILDLADALRNDKISEYVAYRSILLLCTGQIKNLEYVVRNIVIFAEAELYHLGRTNFRYNKPWKTFAMVEGYTRRRVCGVPNTVETPQQRKQMVAVLHGFVALAQHFMHENNLERMDYFVMQYAMKDINRENEQSVIQSFQDHPEETQRLFDFVVSRGPVEQRLLEAVIFYGDDELPSSLFGGVL